MPDQLPNVAVLAALANGRSRVRGAGVTRFHETDRIAAVVEELAKANVSVEVGDTDVVITGGHTKGPAAFSAHGDHRMAMALAAFSAFVGSSTIEGADAVAKTYREFWVDASTIGLDASVVGARQ